LVQHELGFVPLSKTGAELLFETSSQWTETFGSERLTGALVVRLATSRDKRPEHRPLNINDLHQYFGRFCGEKAVQVIDPGERQEHS
jgi:hypothetical protein